MILEYGVDQQMLHAATLKRANWMSDVSVQMIEVAVLRGRSPLLVCRAVRKRASATLKRPAMDALQTALLIP